MTPNLIMGKDQAPLDTLRNWCLGFIVEIVEELIKIRLNLEDYKDENDDKD